mmetsp:Transcript_15460/g.46255  ORF Transcript_15460/g.46255 Transcript_15460/m.46255 type:complete len:1342 (+) Transcript_15460:229-4254(+)|eukprot:CAMPEP_0174231280 /NCGR_PEP_ID=MMETSP0417-20130205/1849_1 /TAXON_ID=242541 /ORGANISM="Mayorella sp, Strain BSH-02190019" /LENGTH=1341 /DNA_ID=CAMNT_0015309135 /DNA_START=95 /DNA_END=4120 /DNA_ORIENTATION=-
MSENDNDIPSTSAESSSPGSSTPASPRGGSDAAVPTIKARRPPPVVPQRHSTMTSADASSPRATAPPIPQRNPRFSTAMVEGSGPSLSSGGSLSPRSAGSGSPGGMGMRGGGRGRGMPATGRGMPVRGSSPGVAGPSRGTGSHGFASSSHGGELSPVAAPTPMHSQDDSSGTHSSKRPLRRNLSVDLTAFSTVSRNRDSMSLSPSAKDKDKDKEGKKKSFLGFGKKTKEKDTTPKSARGPPPGSVPTFSLGGKDLEKVLARSNSPSAPQRPNSARDTRSRIGTFTLKKKEKEKDPTKHRRNASLGKAPEKDDIPVRSHRRTPSLTVRLPGTERKSGHARIPSFGTPIEDAEKREEKDRKKEEKEKKKADRVKERENLEREKEKEKEQRKLEKEKKRMEKAQKKFRSDTISSPSSTGVVTAADGRLEMLTSQSFIITELFANKLTDRNRVALELYTTEVSYLTGLTRVVMVAKDLAQKYLSEEEIELLFSNAMTIYSLHMAFLKDLETRYKSWDDTTCIGDVFLKHVPFWVSSYPLYCASYERGNSWLMKPKQKRSVLQFCAAVCEACKQQSLPSLLILPVQRIPRYRMLLEDLRKKTERSEEVGGKDHPDFENINKAFDLICNLASTVNQEVRSTEKKRAFDDIKSIEGMETYLLPHREFVMESTVEVLEFGSESGTNIEDATRYQRLVLFDDLLVFVSEDTNGELKVADDLHVHLISVGVSPQVELPGKTYPLALNAPESHLIINGCSPLERDSWKATLSATVDRYVSTHGMQQKVVELDEDGEESSVILRRFQHFFQSGDFVDSQYEGQWHTELMVPHGQGRMVFPNKDVYEGSWVAGIRDGLGTMTYQNGSVYTGHWKKHLPFGEGTLTSQFPKGIYKGSWYLGKKHGNGTMVWNSVKLPDEVAQVQSSVDSPIEASKARHRSSKPRTRKTKSKSHRSSKKGSSKILPAGETAEKEIDAAAKSDVEEEEADSVEISPSVESEPTPHHDDDEETGDQAEQVDEEDQENDASNDANITWYHGEFVNDHFHGKGRLVTPQGIYEGSWENSLRHGKGSFETHDGQRSYSGNWLNNLRNGHGSGHWQAGFYEGEWSAHVPNGSGTFVLEDVSRYEGEFEDGEYHGAGVLELHDGVVYTGEFSRGKYHGQGVLVLGDRCRYDGCWQNGKHHGEGELTEFLSNSLKRVYKGSWKNGRRNGQGTQRYEDGFEYSGDWENDLRHGNGTLQANGFLFKYKGAWSMDLRHGIGQQIDASGCYSGAWVRGQRTGAGKFTSSAGTCFDGEWQNDRLHGECTFTSVESTQAEFRTYISGLRSTTYIKHGCEVVQARFEPLFQVHPYTDDGYL